MSLTLNGKDYNLKHGNIRNTESFLNNLWAWDFLNDCFGKTSIKVSDLDGAVERNSHLLIIETKQPNVELNTGQRIMFENLQKTGLVTIFVIWGERNKPEKMRMYYPMLRRHIEGKADVAEVKRWVSGWFNYANKTNYLEAIERQRCFDVC